MLKTGRREFLQSAGVAALGSLLPEVASSAQLRESRDGIEAITHTYTFRYTTKTDLVELYDSLQRLIFSAPLMPVIVERALDQALNARSAVQAAASKHTVEGERIHFEYTLANGSGRVSFYLRLSADALWFEPLQYDAAKPTDVVSVHYFASPLNESALPALACSFLVVPGISEGSSISPIESEEVGLNTTVWLGRGSAPAGINQQWGLPVHYFCGLSKHALSDGTRDIYSKGVSNSFTCGLADLPNGDLFLTMNHGKSSLWINYRSDLWSHLRGPATLALGAMLCLTIGATYYDSIQQYYAALLRERMISVPAASEKKTAATLAPQFCTWGAQVVRGKRGHQLDEVFLNDIYAELRQSGMKASLFSIDDKWEGTYGELVHDAKRLPHFERFLDRLRADGYRIGLWTALMRCETPSALGLTIDNMLRDKDGVPIREGDAPGYYLLDFTQPHVAQILQDLARRFMRRYNPDLVKFDFGYELPNVTQAAPADRKFMGERMLSRGLQIVIPALREINPDVVIMYYNLSPLYLQYFDLHSTDDIFEAYREFSLEANRRIYFGSLMGSLGVPVYGSSGYDWSSGPEIWFDSAAVGTIGSLNDFAEDEAGEKPTPQTIARYNGIAKTLRSTRSFDILPIGAPEVAPTLGAHPRSWVRLEQGQPVLIARRPPEPWSDAALPVSKQQQNLLDSVSADFPVIVSSATKESICLSRALYVVPFGEGPITIRTQQRGTAVIHQHYLGDAIKSEAIQLTGGVLRVTPQLKREGRPLEYITIEFK